MQFGPIGIEEASGEVAQDAAEMGEQARRITADDGSANSCSGHDPLRCFLLFFVASPHTPQAVAWSERVEVDYRAEFVKNQYKFPCDFNLSEQVAKR
jgi:hypothetical protein